MSYPQQQTNTGSGYPVGNSGNGYPAANAGNAGMSGGSGPQMGTGQQDALDKGVDGLLTKLGHRQNDATTEKISDGIRSVFKKVTGKDIPIQDKQ